MELIFIFFLHLQPNREWLYVTLSYGLSRDTCAPKQQIIIHWKVNPSATATGGVDIPSLKGFAKQHISKSEKADRSCLR